eukprot:scaffold84278_cov35-Tisochrysis_lutea.AAC.4
MTLECESPVARYTWHFTHVEVEECRVLYYNSLKTLVYSPQPQSVPQSPTPLYVPPWIQGVHPPRAECVVPGEGKPR